jgi:hypothetical protein
MTEETNNENDKMKTIYDEIRDERKHQDIEWRGLEHDDNHSRHDFADFADFADFIRDDLSRSINGPIDEERYQLIRVAALAVAAIERYDRLFETKGNKMIERTWEKRDVAGLEVLVQDTDVEGWIIEKAASYVAYDPKGTRVYFNKDDKSLSIMHLGGGRENVPITVIMQLMRRVLGVPDQDSQESLENLVKGI